MMIAVLPLVSRRKFSWIARSVSVSTALVASSSSKIGASLSMARAILSRWR